MIVTARKLSDDIINTGTTTNSVEISRIWVHSCLKGTSDSSLFFLMTAPSCRVSSFSRRDYPAILFPCDYLLFLTKTNQPSLLEYAKDQNIKQSLSWIVTDGRDGAFSFDSGWSPAWTNIVKLLRKKERSFEVPSSYLNRELIQLYGTNICHEIIPAVKAAVAYLEAPESEKKTLAESFRRKGGIYKDFIEDATYVPPTDEELWLEDFAHYKTTSSNLLSTICATNTYAVISAISDLEYYLPMNHQEKEPYIYVKKYAAEVEEARLRFGMRYIQAIYRYSNRSTTLTTNAWNHLNSKPKETWAPEEHTGYQEWSLHCTYDKLVRTIQQRIRTTSPVRELTLQWINEEVQDPTFKEILRSRKYLEDYEAAERARISKYLDEQDAKLKTYADRYAKTPSATSSTAIRQWTKSCAIRKQVGKILQASPSH